MIIATFTAREYPGILKKYEEGLPGFDNADSKLREVYPDLPHDYRFAVRRVFEMYPNDPAKRAVAYNLMREMCGD